MKEIDKLKETLQEIHKLVEKSVLYLPKLESLYNKRELKFRAWNNEDKEYQRIDTIIFGGVNNPDKILSVRLYTKRSKYTGESYFYEIGSVVLEQYTGLKDKNGKEIYEGDIVNIQGIKYYVDFEFGGFWFNNDNRKWKANRPFTHFQEINDAEVIGNIHENPELLEDDK